MFESTKDCAKQFSTRDLPCTADFTEWRKGTNENSHWHRGTSVGIVSRNHTGQETIHNGFWWVNSSDQFKIGFVTGFAIAMTQLYDAGSFACLVEKGDEAMKACIKTKVLPFDYTKIRLGQLSEGVDEFYKDFRNKGIDITHAMVYVRDELKGKSANELEEELSQMRNLNR
jgi:hypothetical protein